MLQLPGSLFPRRTYANVDDEKIRLRELPISIRDIYFVVLWFNDHNIICQYSYMSIEQNKRKHCKR
jgi:hypothetical protein